MLKAVFRSPRGTTNTATVEMRESDCRHCEAAKLRRESRRENACGHPLRFDLSA
jgi:hypothetical protein